MDKPVLDPTVKEFVHSSNVAQSDAHPAIDLYNLLCKAAGYEPKNVKSLTVKFEVGEPVLFHFVSMADHKDIEQLTTEIRKLIPSIAEKVAE